MEENKKEALNEKSNEDNSVEVPKALDTEYYLSKLKAGFMKFLFGGIALFILGIILYFAIKSDWSIGGLAGFVGLGCIWVGYLKYGSRNINNIVIVTASCVDKSRSGYRKQYLNYTFEDEDKNSFIIKTAQKEHFKKGLRYNLCLDKTTYEKGEMSGSSLLYFENA